MDHTASTSLEGCWRSEHHMPFASSSSSKFRSHTAPSDYAFGTHHNHHLNGDERHGHSQLEGDEASSAWSSSLAPSHGTGTGTGTGTGSGSSTTATARPVEIAHYKAGSSSTWPRYMASASASASAAGTSTSTGASRSSLSAGAYPYPYPQQHQPSDSQHAFPGPGYPLVPVHSVAGADAKGKGKAIYGSGADGEDDADRDMGLTGRIKVLAGVMDTSKGRDKVLKCGQYSMRTYLYLLSLILRIRPLPRWFISNRKRVQQAVSGLSMTRKCLLLLNPLHPIADLLSPQPATASEIIMHLIDLVSAISDDLFCLSKLGLVSRRLGKRADLWANRLWLLSTIIGLYRLHTSKLPKLRARLRDLPEPSVSDGIVAVQRREASRGLKDAVWSNRKYLADLVFVSYDVFELSWMEEPIKCAAGLVAAFISTSKIYDAEYIASQGK